jgi:hypothetical protein
MIHIETFISNAYIAGCEATAHEFTSIYNRELMERVRWNSTYLSGAILVIYDNRELLGLSNSDVIDFSWIMLFNGIESLLKEGKASVNSSEGAFAIELKSVSNNKILFDNHTIKVELPKKEFLSSVLLAAEDFFNTVSKFGHTNGFPSNVEINQVKNKVLVL